MNIAKTYEILNNVNNIMKDNYKTTPSELKFVEQSCYTITAGESLRKGAILESLAMAGTAVLREKAPLASCGLGLVSSTLRVRRQGLMGAIKQDLRVGSITVGMGLLYHVVTNR